MREGMLEQGTIWFRSRLPVQDPNTLPEPPDGSEISLSPCTSHWETEHWARKG